MRKKHTRQPLPSCAQVECATDMKILTQYNLHAHAQAAGGKVMTIDQIEGAEPVHENWDCVLGEELDEVGDPPRVWCAALDRPGCAFTRSIGDR